ncbi:MAG: hypothetical protein CVU07_07205 [Bacteroidetes bacterium HGW-Bacteroidetes-23]|nr:MAG: hypothetical protein CVU07_07205 [Bacteroidetes bacterium HGW-Bacteroidetes-23]
MERLEGFFLTENTESTEMRFLRNDKIVWNCDFFCHEEKKARSFWKLLIGTRTCLPVGKLKGLAEAKRGFWRIFISSFSQRRRDAKFKTLFYYFVALRLCVSARKFKLKLNNTTQKKA